MQKIMFNDKCGLTEAVLAKRKTQTRRIIPTKRIFGKRYQKSEWNAMWERQSGFLPAPLLTA